MLLILHYEVSMTFFLLCVVLFYFLFYYCNYSYENALIRQQMFPWHCTKTRIKSPLLFPIFHSHYSPASFLFCDQHPLHEFPPRDVQKQAMRFLTYETGVMYVYIQVRLGVSLHCSFITPRGSVFGIILG